MAGQLENDADVALSKLSPEKLLLCGLQLLSKINASNVSLAAVQPRLQSKSEILNPGSPPLSSTLLIEPQNTPPSSPEEHQSVPQSDPANGRKRKRRGDNSELSVNERREKRRLMNRVAAQNARDRKKVYVDDLERRVAELEAKNAKLQQENQSLRQRTATLEAEKHQLETQLHHEPHTPPFLTGTYSSTLGSEQLLESGSAAEADSEGSLCSSAGDSEFDSLAHLLQDCWPEYDITSSASHDAVADTRCQSHDLHQPQGASQETSVVGGQTIHVEPPCKQIFDAFQGPSDPLATRAECSETFSDFPNCVSPCFSNTQFTGSDFSDMCDSELEKILSPFTDSSDPNFDPDCFDLEAFLTA